jgi:hypothetical protein
MRRPERAALTAAGECIAFIDGALGLAQVIGMDHKRAIFCIPERVTSVELAALYVQAIDRLPAHRADPAAAALYITLINAFPCKQ